jgi:hypothetical protein
LPDPSVELQRLTLYLPGGVLDQAEALALRAGAESVQAYCETLLRDAIAAQHTREQVVIAEVRANALGGLDAIANDPDYLAELSASARPEMARSEPPALEAATEGNNVTDEPSTASSAQKPMSQAAELVLRHALVIGDDPEALLAVLRRGEPIGPDSARELLQALIDLEREHRGATQIDRRLAFALHRLAFEGQVLLTDSWPGIPAHPATVDALRLVQEAVDRVLSGEDIRYYAEGSESSP